MLGKLGSCRVKIHRASPCTRSAAAQRSSVVSGAGSWASPKYCVAKNRTPGSSWSRNGSISAGSSMRARSVAAHTAHRTGSRDRKGARGAREIVKIVRPCVPSRPCGPPGPSLPALCSTEAVPRPAVGGHPRLDAIAAQQRIARRSARPALRPWRGGRGRDRPARGARRRDRERRLHLARALEPRGARGPRGGTAPAADPGPARTRGDEAAALARDEAGPRAARHLEREERRRLEREAVGSRRRGGCRGSRSPAATSVSAGSCGGPGDAAGAAAVEEGHGDAAPGELAHDGLSLPAHRARRASALRARLARGEHGRARIARRGCPRRAPRRPGARRRRGAALAWMRSAKAAILRGSRRGLRRTPRWRRSPSGR